MSEGLGWKVGFNRGGGGWWGMGGGREGVELEMLVGSRALLRHKHS